MPSGYEKSPDYGGPEPWLGGWFAVAVMVVIIALAIIVAANRPANAQQGISVEGQLDCGQWIAARTDKTADYFEHYLLGLLNGLALGKMVEFWHADGTSVSREAVFLWMDGYCRENPLDQIVTGTFKLYSERSGWQPG